MEQLSCGELGLKLSYFYSLTPREFLNVLIGIRKKEYQEHKDSWEQARMQMYFSLLPYSNKKDFTLTDVLEFPWEEKKPKKIIRTIEEINKMI